MAAPMKLNRSSKRNLLLGDKNLY